MHIRMKQDVIARFGAAALVTMVTGAVPALGQFTSENAELLSQIPLNGFSSNPGNGNDCWGYVSASGREYALMGLANIVAVVEVTDPSNPVIISEVPHTNSLWCDVKTYQTYAYAVNESGGGIDVINLGGVDLGSVSYQPQHRDQRGYGLRIPVRVEPGRRPPDRLQPRESGQPGVRGLRQQPRGRLLP